MKERCVREDRNVRANKLSRASKCRKRVAEKFERRIINIHWIFILTYLRYVKMQKQILAKKRHEAFIRNIQS